MGHNYKERGVEFQSVKEYFPSDMQIGKPVFRIVTKMDESNREDILIHEVYRGVLVDSFTPNSSLIPIAGTPNMSIDGWDLERVGRGELDIDEVLESEFSWDKKNGQEGYKEKSE